jgi:AcrR family transcriptional regulator
LPKRTDQPSRAAAKPPLSFVERARGDSPSTAKNGELKVGIRAKRTRDQVIATARELFLRQGYDGTKMDDIADAAQMSRGSVYTYFKSKRDVLLSMGVDGTTESFKTLASLGDLPVDWSLEDVQNWISQYFDHLERHGGYMLMWSQAAARDDDLKRVGMRGSMKAARIASESMRKLGASTDVENHVQGLALMALLDRFWYHWRVTEAPLMVNQVTRGLAIIVASMLRGG